jgi:GntR family transcriptional regulator
MISDQPWTSTSLAYLQPRAVGQPDAWTEETTAQARRGVQRILAAGETVPSADVARALELDEGETAIARRRVMYLDDQPVELTDSYYPPRIARGTRLAEPGKIRGGAVTLLAEMGYTADRVREDVSARMPTADERDALALGENEPVLVLTRVTFTSDARPMEVSVMTMRASTQQLRYETKVG